MNSKPVLLLAACADRKVRQAARLSDLAIPGKHIGLTDTMPPGLLRRIALSSPEIEVWQAPLDVGAESVVRFTELLSPDERLRAQRFHYERDRRRYVVARGVLRVLLGDYLGTPPASIAFGYTKYGKPVVAEPAAQIQFNLSHSEERALYAISRSRRLGVDIEYLNRDIDHEGLAKRFFAPGEYAALQRMRKSGRRRAFLACWTRKEAVAKALGRGLLLPLDQFEVTVALEAAPRVHGFIAAAHGLADWHLYSVNTDNDYFATVASCHAWRNIRETAHAVSKSA